MTESYAPEHDVEDSEHHQVDNSSKIVDLVSLDPVLTPAWIVSERINFLSISHILIFFFPDGLSSRINCLWLSAKNLFVLNISPLSNFVIPLVFRISLDIGVKICVNSHHDDDDIEGVEEPHVNHLDV